jgi:hypothetical protein
MTIRAMRSIAAVSLIALVSSCAPVRETMAPPAAPPGIVGTTESPAASPSMSTQPVESAKASSREISGIVFEGVAYDSRSHRLMVVDQAGGPGSQFPDAAAASRSRGGIAAVNAGFFTPQGDPLGLVIASGKRAGSWNAASSLGSGIWHQDSAGDPAISRRETLGHRGAGNQRELLQAGPVLVEHGRAVGGLESTKSSVRTIILWDGGTRWWIGRASACTLAALATILASNQPAGRPIRHALNLDGGRSADLWISESVAGGPITRRPPWNRPVRNFLVLAPK